MEIEAKEDDAMKTSMLKSLKQVSDARQKFVKGSASSAELTSIVNSSTRVAVDCTKHIIRLFTEVGL